MFGVAAGKIHIVSVYTPYSISYCLFNVPTVFMSEQVYHAFYKPLEFTIAERDANQCYIKVSSDFLLVV